MLLNLIRELQLGDVRSLIFIIPGINVPAVKAGLRLSPIDGANLNRSFPSDATGTPTQMIAHFIETVLIPRVDYVFNFHSGGKAMELTPWPTPC